MNSRRTAFLLAALAVGASAREPQAPAETIRQLAGYARRNDDLQKRLLAATEKACRKSQAAQTRVSALQRPYVAEQVERIKRRLVSDEAQLDALRGEVEVAGVRERGRRQTKLEELGVEAITAQEAVQQAVRSLDKEREEQRQKQAPVEKLIAAQLVPVGRAAEDLGAASAHASTEPRLATARVVWHDAQGKRLAYLRLRLLPSQRGPGKEAVKLVQKYPIHHLNDHSLDFSVGTMNAHFSSRKTEWRSREKLPKVVEALVDFGALAGLATTLEEGGELRRKLDDCVSREQEWQTRMRDATQGPRSWQSTVQRQINELRNPYGAGRLEQLENRLASQEKSVAKIRAELSIAVIEDPEKRKAAQAKADQELQRARRGVQEARVPLRPEVVAMMRQAKYLEFALWEMVDAVVRTPEDTGIIEASVRVRVERNRYEVGVLFRDAHVKQLVRAGLRFQPMPKSMTVQTKLAGRHPARIHGDSNIRISAGGVTVTLDVQKTEWHDEDKLLKLAASLLDLDAIAAWPKIEDAE